MKCVVNCSCTLLGMMVVLMKLVLVAGSPVVPQKSLVTSSSVSSKYNKEIKIDFSEAEFKDSIEELVTNFPGNDQRLSQLEKERGNSDGVVYLESLTMEGLGKENGEFHLAQVLSLMMDLLQKEVTGDKLPGIEGAVSDSQQYGSQVSLCAAPCGRERGTINIPLCFSCVGLVNAHLQPVTISRKQL